MELRILGPLEAVDDDGVTIPLGGPRARAVLARLLVQPNTTVSIDSLVDAVWGESPPATATGALQVHVSSLRKALGADRIVTRAPGYSLLVDERELDAARFQQLVDEGVGSLESGNAARAKTLLADALELWRGPALADLAYEPFAQREAERLEELRLVALERRLDADIALGRDAELVGRARDPRRRTPAARASPCAAHGRPLPLRTPGRRACRVPGCQERPRRPARDRARNRAARARASRSPAGPRARPRTRCLYGRSPAIDAAHRP